MTPWEILGYGAAIGGAIILIGAPLALGAWLHSEYIMGRWDKPRR